MSVGIPLVSVVIPAYNAERFLGETIESVLAQGHDRLEIVVVDDGSTDATAEVARSFGSRVRLFLQGNSGGPASPRNRGVGLARGELIAFLDADDLWPADRLAVQLPHFEDPAARIVMGHTRRIWAARGSDVFDRSTGPELAMKLEAALIRRQVFDRVGRFDTALRICDDWDWFLRARELGEDIRVHPEVTILYRRHDTNITADEEAGNREFMTILKRSLDRRRRRGGAAPPSLTKLSDLLVHGSGGEPVEGERS